MPAELYYLGLFSYPSRAGFPTSAVSLKLSPLVAHSALVSHSPLLPNCPHLGAVALPFLSKA